MYTQCPDCATVFRVSAAMLRAAQGDVRCGVCATTFNALENLSEKPFKQGPPGIPTLMPEDSMTVEELPGGDDIELPTEEPESAPPSPAAPKPAAPKPKPAAVKSAEPKPAPVKPAEPKPAAVKPAEPKPAAAKPVAPAPAAVKPAAPKPAAPTPVAPVQSAAAPVTPTPVVAKPAAPKPAAEAATAPTDDKALEFHGDIADLDRLFVTMPAAEMPRFDAVTIEDEDRERTDEFPILVLDERDEPEEIILETPKEQLEAPDSLETPRFVIPDEMRKGLVAEAAAAAGTVTLVDFDNTGDTNDTRRWPWTVAVAALGVLFVAQVVHGQRDQLIRKPGIGPLLAQSYALLGLPFAMPTDLAAFELRQLGAANDASGAGRLLLRASIVNRAGFSQPFPLLRLALQDRFGTTLFVRDIEPGDYLPREGAPRLIAPGARADAEIRIVDPGQDAVGFEMDVCLPAEGGVHCANQLAAAKP